jgi:hypothetical protein
MRAASPPASAADLLEAQNQKPGPAARPFRRVNSYPLFSIRFVTNCNRDFYLQTLVKQSSLDESLTMELDNNDQADDELREIEERRAMEESGEIPQPPSPRPTTPAPRKGSIHYKQQFSTGKQKKYISFLSFSTTMDTESSSKGYRSISRYHANEICRFHAPQRSSIISRTSFANS